MHQLWYSPYGTDPWVRFRTGLDYWRSSRGRAMTDEFELYVEAEETVREWFASPPCSHYPVAIFPDGNMPPAAIFHDPENWPLMTGKYQKFATSIHWPHEIVVVV